MVSDLDIAIASPSFASLLLQEVLSSARWCFGLSAHTLPALGLALLEKFTNREASFHKASLRYNLSGHFGYCARRHKNRYTILIVEGELEA